MIAVRLLFALTFACQSSFGLAALTDNLAAYYAFENSPNDSTANGRNMVVTGTMAYTTGKVGTCATPTSTNYFNITNPTWFDSKTAYSIQYWCFDTATGSNECLTSYGTANANFVIVHYPWNSNGGNGWSSFVKGATAIKLTNNRPTPSAWNHVVLVCESAASTKLYINGNLESTNTTNNFTTPASQTNLRIGMYHNGAQGYTGNVDEYAIWLRALSQAEVTQLYNSGNGLSYSQLTPPKLGPSLLNQIITQRIPSRWECELSLAL